MDIDRLKELREETEQYRAVADDRCMSTSYEDDLLALIDEAIARQTVTSEEAQRAIELLREPSKRMDYYWLDAQMHDALNLAITALQQYQPTIPKTETDGCEWCEKVGKYAQFDFATYTEVDGDKECEYAVKVNYCPNCGRRLEETI